ncbi:TetR/AcrR family transcriptional regulator [Nodosilinea sp. LEGE 07088]|uniref:TetR/AcrR family transcriptional regulator n=1 Tax=Nodosilinea sp. LEGE 07088 TaxID=2777968 RepID=UPI0018803EE1|nr:TetR/AcrR family transcriptional regulator [Nodosilinea sp. LEGE 07088]MBE9141027.1 TetR/AcrR family transcriptional regulator [Nodosilinea sp. LEGE 07088]
MPRHKEFDPENCLNQVMHLFWEKGYQDTSIADLVQRSGVQRYGLYETFGDKQELFQRALDWYLSTVISQYLARLESEDSEPSLTEIEIFFEQFIDYLDHPSSSLGCLICNTAVEGAVHDPIVISRVQQYLERLRRAFARALKSAQHNGELAEGTDIVQITEFLTGSVLGISTYARSPASREDVKRYVRGILAMLKQL